jgi:hypothetical protein
VVQQYFLWHGAELVAELNASGGLRAEYAYYPGLDHPHAVVVNGTVYYLHRDGMGNVIGLVSQSKTLTGTYEYDRFGHSESWQVWEDLPTGVTNRARYKGALWMGDLGVELYYMRNRWYERRCAPILGQSDRRFVV